MSLDAIGIVCDDLKKSIDFYTKLGLKFEKSSADHFEGVTLSGVRIMLDSVELIQKLYPNWKRASGGSPLVLCFKQDSKPNVDEVFEALRSIGAKELKEPWDAFWGQRYASLLDPDNNQIDIFC